MMQFFQIALGYGPRQAGMRSLLWTATPKVAPLAGSHAARHGNRPFIVLGQPLELW
jgi:hypothetical protein